VDTSQPSSNFGTSTQLRIDGSPVVNGYVTFNVAGVAGTVTSATLRVFANSGQAMGYTAFAVPNTTWAETTITAANAPPPAATLGASGKITASTWTSADVTSAVAGNGTYSFVISTTNATAVSFSSREGANPPQLVVNWASPAAVLPPLAPPPSNANLPVLLLGLPFMAPALILVGRRPERRILGGVPAFASRASGI
jgi:hypothetical protein